MTRNFITCLIFFFSFTSLVSGAHHGTIKHLNSGAVLPTNLPFSEIVIAGGMIFYQVKLEIYQKHWILPLVELRHNHAK